MRVVSKTWGSNLRTRTETTAVPTAPQPRAALPPSLSGPPAFTAARVNGLNDALMKHHGLLAEVSRGRLRAAVEKPLSLSATWARGPGLATLAVSTCRASGSSWVTHSRTSSALFTRH